MYQLLCSVLYLKNVINIIKKKGKHSFNTRKVNLSLYCWCLTTEAESLTLWSRVAVSPAPAFITEEELCLESCPVYSSKLPDLFRKQQGACQVDRWLEPAQTSCLKGTWKQYLSLLHFKCPHAIQKVCVCQSSVNNKLNLNEENKCERTDLEKACPEWVECQGTWCL